VGHPTQENLGQGRRMTDVIGYIFWKPLIWLYHKIKSKKRDDTMKKKKKEPTIDDIEVIDPCEDGKYENED